MCHELTMVCLSGAKQRAPRRRVGSGREARPPPSTLIVKGAVRRGGSGGHRRASQGKAAPHLLLRQLLLPRLDEGGTGG